MSSWLPPDLRKQGARSTQAREEALLDNFEVCRDIEAALLSTASSMEYIDEARRMGLTVTSLMHDEESKQHLYQITLDDKVIALLHAIKGETNLYPSENRWA